MDEFEQAQAQIGKPGVAGWWERLDLTDQQKHDLERAGRNLAISHRAISIVLGQWGFDVNPVQVGHWRRSVLGTARR